MLTYGPSSVIRKSQGNEARRKENEMGNELNALYNARENALRDWDATEYNRIDGLISEKLAYMRAEVRLGLRDDPIATFTLE